MNQPDPDSINTQFVTSLVEAALRYLECQTHPFDNVPDTMVDFFICQLCVFERDDILQISDAT